MNRRQVEQVVHAVLYEGYILYPYRPSIKNRQRWTFGGIYPRRWSEAQTGADAWSIQTECLVTVGALDSAGLHTQAAAPAVRATARFLHLTDRTVGALATPAEQWDAQAQTALAPTPSLAVGERVYEPWQEAAEREADAGELDLGALAAHPMRREFDFPADRTYEPIRADGVERGGGAGGAEAAPVVGALIRDRQALRGAIEASCAPVDGETWKLTLRLLNLTPLPDPDLAGRDAALMRSFVSAHLVLEAVGCRFESLTDAPDRLRQAAGACRNQGVWPVLVGDPGERDALLASPIILPDYPEIAAESPGDLFDSTEIDEILTLRIMTLTEEERRAAANVDERVRKLLRRTDALARDQLMGLHGTLRGLRTVDEKGHS